MRYPRRPPNWLEYFAKGTPELSKALQEHGSFTHRKYLHWDDLRHRKPPAGLSKELWWAWHKAIRRQSLHTLPLLDQDYTTFSYNLSEALHTDLHLIDRAAKTELPVLAAIAKQRHAEVEYADFVREAITSSQLEGAATETGAATTMLLNAQHPMTPGERMISNNFAALSWVRENYSLPITPSRVLLLHQRILEGSSKAQWAGRFRPEEGEESDVRVENVSTQEVLHVPPPAAELPERLENLCAFAMDQHSQPFVHPVIRAMSVHFMLGYDHPFVDGNGRTARALFYWVMLRSGYHFMKDVAVSQILRDAPAQYVRAYLLTETDESDLTYFLEYHARVICRAIQSQLPRDEEAPQSSLPPSAQAAVDLRAFSVRQQSALRTVLASPAQPLRVVDHQGVHNVTRNTAQTDLDQLAKMGVLDRRKSGKEYVYYAARDISARLKTISLESSPT